MDVAPDMEVEWTSGVLNVEAVTSQVSPINLGGEFVTNEGLKHINSISDISHSLKNNLGYPKSCFPTIPNVTEDVINMPSSIRPVEEKITLSAINMGINLGDANLNTKIFGPATTSRVLELMQKTLDDSNTANHAPNPTINDTLIQAVDED